MAFEDRFSPNTATSPGSDSSRMNYPNSPESTRTQPYTCLTIPQSQEKEQHYITSASSSPTSFCPKSDQEKNFIRITSFALPSPKDNSTRSENDSPISYRNSPSPSSSIGSSGSRSSPPPSNNEPTIQTLKYSIFNILQPDFGRNAVQKTRPLSKISFKPYETRPSEEVSISKTAPLGSLCQTVSQIGSAKRTVEAVKPALSLVAEGEKKEENSVPTVWPAWVYCTRYSDRPSSGPRSRRTKKPSKPSNEEKRPRTAFSSAQLQRLKHEFNENRYLTERRRQQLSAELGLNEAQIKIWFQNKRAKIKKSSSEKNPLALQLMAQGLYNHSTVACDEDEMPMS